MARSSTNGSESTSESARREILSAARSTILRYGFAKTTMDDIAKEAGISRPTVYRYFQDRTELVSALVDWRAREVRDETARFVAARPESESFTDRLVSGLLKVVETARNDPIVAVVLNPSNQQGATWLQTLELAATLTADLWGDFFTQAQERGEMRADLDRDELFTWLTMVQFSLFNQMEFVNSDDPTLARLLRTYVMPALVPAAAQVEAV